MADNLEWAFADLIGVPWRDGGRDPATGLDCFGLLLVMLARMGATDVPDVPYDSANKVEAVAKLIAAERENRARAATINDVGATVLFRVPTLPHAKHVNHIGMIIEPGRFIHALNPHGVRLDYIERNPWKRRISGAYFWPIKFT